MAFIQEHQKIIAPGLFVEVAQTSDDIKKAQSLRYQVFCLERKLFDVGLVNSLDQDAFDQAAQHIVVRRSADREVIATSRIVRTQVTDHGIALPMFNYCCPTLLRGLPIQTVGEISRFAISKQARGADASTGPAIRLLLLRGILQASQVMGLTHWCALMEPSLIRLLSATGLQFTALGPLVEAYGQRQPCFAWIDQAVSRGRISHPRFHEAVTTRVYSRQREGPFFRRGPF